MRISDWSSDVCSSDLAMRNIVILTGAGVSAESGIDTFRGAGGLWEQHRVEDVATPEAFARDPDLVHRFYDARRAAIQAKAPNAAHEALARLHAAWPGPLLIGTQHIKDLSTDTHQSELPSLQRNPYACY